jgi:importin subunit alpha-1
MRTLGGVLTGDDTQTQAAIDAGIVPQLGKLLSSPNATVRKEAAWALSNITAGSVPQIDVVMQANIMHKLLELANQDTFDVRRECIWGISNASSGASVEQAKVLIAAGSVGALCSILGTTEARTLAIAIEGLENFLKKAKDLPGGVC